MYTLIIRRIYFFLLRKTRQKAYHRHAECCIPLQIMANIFSDLFPAYLYSFAY